MGADFDWKHNVTAHSAGPNLDVGRERSSKSKKEHFLDSSSRIVSFPPPPPIALKQCFASPSAPSQHALGWIPFLTKIQLHRMKSSPAVRALLFY